MELQIDNWNPFMLLHISGGVQSETEWQDYCYSWIRTLLDIAVSKLFTSWGFLSGNK